MIINEITGEKTIDLNNLPSVIDIPLQSIISINTTYQNKDIFTLEETIVNDSSASIKYCQFGSKMLIEVFGPREVKFRDKMKNDTAIIETYIKLNHEANKESI
jgi:hypothetical protein